MAIASCPTGQGNLHLYPSHAEGAPRCSGVKGNAMITVIIDKERREIEASSPMEALEALCLPPDSYLILRDNIPIPIDEPLSDGDVIRAVRVASGG